MDTKPPLPNVHNSGSNERFRIRCDAGDDNCVRVTTESLTLTAGKRVLGDGTLEMWHCVSIYAEEDQDSNLVVEVLVFDPDWDEPIPIAFIRSRPQDARCLPALAFCLDHVTE